MICFDPTSGCISIISNICSNSYEYILIEDKNISLPWFKGCKEKYFTVLKKPLLLFSLIKQLLPDDVKVKSFLSFKSCAFGVQKLQKSSWAIWTEPQMYL